ncbi:MAG: hypothetical protein IJB60_00005 [Bacteroidaceae bacterium]|nr:hypothetical protein [Bacteroidaceae bacterium]
MKKLFTLFFCALAMTSQVRADKVVASQTMPNEGRPEHVYTMVNGNGAYVSPTTTPVSGDEDYGQFAFYAVDGVSGAYYIYSHNANKWLSYTKAYSYSGKKGFIEMTDSKTEGAYFYVNNYSDDYYEISPYDSYGSKASIYLNYFQGVPANAGMTLGLWTDGGATDGGSRYTFAEVVYVVRTYTISIPDASTITIDGQKYGNGDQITVEGSIEKSDVIVNAGEGKFAVVSINDVENTITVDYAVLPAQPACQPYENAWVYPKQQDNVGAAVATENENVWTLSNNVLAASYIKVGNAIYFAGSNAMDLMAGTEPFTVAFGSGDNVPASAMTLKSVGLQNLTANSSAIGGAEHFAGVALVAEYEYTYNEAKIEIVWRAVLRDGSHYLRTEMELLGVNDVDMYNVIPMIYNVDTDAAGSTPAVVGNTRGAVLMSNKIFAGLETPTAYNTVGEASGEVDPWELADTKTASLTASSWTQVASSDVPPRVTEATGASYPNVLAYKMENVELKEGQKVEIEVKYTSGNHRLNFGGADLLEQSGAIAAVDYHSGYSGGQHSNNTFTYTVPYDGTFAVRVFVENITESIDATSTMTVKIYNAKEGVTVNTAVVGIQGRWSRNTTLAAGETWKVASVVGLIAQDGSETASDIHDTQKRRSFLAYSERERAVPWRTFPHYNSWYELNINRNNAAPGSEHTNFTADQVLDVIEQWKTNYYDKFGEGIVAFVIDDGWDNYGPWTFHSGFPNEMRDIAAAAKEIGAGVGAWLGPVGGYGQSGNYRRQYWSDKGGMQLSNPLYYQAFLDAARNLVCEQDGVDGFDANSDNYLFFKFDGISAQFSAVGPDAGDTGNENAEGIIRLERYVREELREDIFFNTTVGTWASPFWYQISDGTWRQENDYGEAGDNSIDREKWITYRDRLVYQNYVQNSPICPINTLMTHGFILTNFGAVSKNMTYDAVLRELRCAFVCGSGMVELYADYERLNNINSGKLWEDLAECVAWQKKNADVLPDAHWVGGNPWTGSVQEVYGWASWNGIKATLALRNGANNAQTYTFTLREALNIPANINGSMIFTKSFKVQDALTGFTEGEAIDYDKQLTVTLPASSVFAFDGEDTNAPLTVNSQTPIEAVEELAEIKFTFNGEIAVAFDEDLKLTGNGVEVAVTPAIDGKVLTLTLADAISIPGEYTLEVPAGKITRLSDGSAFEGGVYTFTVKAMDPLAIVSVNPAEEVESLSVVELTFNYDVLSNLTEEDVISVTADGVSVATTASVDGKVLTLTLDEAITIPGVYTVVVPADKIVRVKDNAVFAGQTITITVVAPDYYTPSNTGTKTNTGRNVTAVSLSSPTYGANTYSLESSEQRSDYVDATEKVTFKVQTGETVTASVTTSGEWIHHYVYIDTDADGFDYGIESGSSYAPTGDLYAYSFYNNNSSSDESGWNSVGNVITGNNRSKPSVPSFTAPATAGTYRMRFKQDWSNIDPMGDADGKFGDFKANGGQIIDVMLEVVWPVGIESIEADSKVKGIYDLTGRKLESISTPGIYIVDGKKTLVK